MSGPAVPLRIAVVGLGTIGRAVAAAVAGDPTTALAGLIDIDPAVIRIARNEIGLPHAAKMAVGDDPEALADADAAIVCASPRFDRVAPTLRRLLRQKIPVVAACAEMTWPWLRHPHLSDVLAGEACDARIALVGGNVYPGLGWWPDLVPKNTGVRRVSVRRRAVISPARPSVVRRCGLGKTASQFAALARQKLVGQPGLGECAVLVAQSLGRHPTQSQVATTVVPLLAETVVDSELGRFEPGQVIGIRQRAAYQDDEVDIDLELTVTLAPAEATTEWQLGDDSSPQQATTDDVRPAATAETLIAAARRVHELPPGLRTVLDLWALPAIERHP